MAAAVRCIQMAAVVARGSSLHCDAPVAAVLAYDRLLGLDCHSRPCREVRPNPCLLESLDDEVSRNAVLGDEVALSVAAGDQPDHGFDVESEEWDSADDALRSAGPAIAS
jgi:hypothetical protein